MGKLLEVLGVVTVILSVLYILVAKTAFQEIAIAVMWSGGWMMFAAGIIIRRLDRLIDTAPRSL